MEGEPWAVVFIPIWGPVKHGAVVPPSRLAIRPVVHEMALRVPSLLGGLQVLSSQLGISLKDSGSAFPCKRVHGILITTTKAMVEFFQNEKSSASLC